MLIVLANLANLTGIGSFEFQIFGYFDGVGINQKKRYDHCGFCPFEDLTCNVNAGERIINDCEDQAITPQIPPDAYDMLMSTDSILDFRTYSKGIKQNFTS